MDDADADADANEFTFDIPLVDSNEEAAGLKFRNTPNEVHRKWVTGSDRTGTTTAVRGRLVHMVHGFHSLSFPPHLDLLDPDEHHNFRNVNLADGDCTPCTLIVLEWDMIPGSIETSHRFRSVTIDLVFSALHPRLGKKPKADISGYDPVPSRIAPPDGDPLTSHFTPVKALYSSGWSAGPTVGYDPYFSVSAEYKKSQQFEVQYIASCWIAGKILHANRASGDPNAVRFQFMENKEARTGVPTRARTAILVHRQEGDLTGLFAMTVKVSSQVNWLQDQKEKLRSAVGFKRDDPVRFDPAVDYVLQEGQKIKRKDFRIEGVDWRRLADVDLNQFLLNHGGGCNSEAEDSDASDASLYEDAQETL